MLGRVEVLSLILTFAVPCLVPHERGLGAPTDPGHLSPCYLA